MFCTPLPRTPHFLFWGYEVDMLGYIDSFDLVLQRTLSVVVLHNRKEVRRSE